MRVSCSLLIGQYSVNLEEHFRVHRIDWNAHIRKSDVCEYAAFVKTMTGKQGKTISQTDLCSDYSQRLIDALPGDDFVEQFRIHRPEKFRALCFLQLSFLIEVPLELYHEFSDTDDSENPPSAIKRMLRFGRPTSECTLVNISM